MVATDTGAVLAALRLLLSAANVTLPDRKQETVDLQAYIVPRSDAHQSEYVAEWDERLKFVSGFSGSAGTAVITLDSAALWTDSRYFLQAREQMDDNWILMKQGVEGTPEIGEYLCDKLKPGSKIGVNPTILTAELFKKYNNDFKACGLTLLAVKQSLIDQVWIESGTKPAVHLNKIFPLDLQYTGKTMWEKIEDVRQKMLETRSSLLVVSDLYDMAWLLNLRGSDIPYNPVFFSNAIVENDFVTLFLHKSQVTENIQDHLINCTSTFVNATDEPVKCRILPYETFYDALNVIAEGKSYESNARIWLPKESANYAAASAFPKETHFTDTSPVSKLKATKNAVEMEGMKLSHIKDGAAVTQFLQWLYTKMTRGGPNPPLTEVDVANKLEEFRRQDPDLVSLSFDTISAVGGHASKPHYKTTVESNAPLDITQCYLVDSGGQYMFVTRKPLNNFHLTIIDKKFRDTFSLGGTTDITRTLFFSPTPSHYYKECYTRQIYPATDMVGMRLDTIARMNLWDVGLDFGHGTGHGVGSFLGVHEGPASIAQRGEKASQEKIEPNMILTIEPGFYEDNVFGIRIENAYAVIETNDTKYSMPNMKFLKFEPLTYAPIETAHVLKELMKPEQILWLNNYHAEVLKKVGAVLHQRGKISAVNWLREQCRPLLL